MTEHEKIAAINNALEEWFALNKDVHTIQAKELMDVFMYKGIFAKNHRDGLPLRNLLRKLDEERRLEEMPFVYAERKLQNAYWYFKRQDYIIEAEESYAPFDNTNVAKLHKTVEPYNTLTTGYDYYAQALKTKLDPNTEQGLYTAISIAYSWMPTMVDLYMDKYETLEDYIPHVLYFKNCSKLDVHQKREDTRTHIAILAGLINNSVVGASKALHILYPETVPIIDSNVIMGWNHFFAESIVKYPEVKLMASFSSANKERQTKEYLKYWDMLNSWMRNTGVNNIRELEEPFYRIGRNLNKHYSI